MLNDAAAIALSKSAEHMDMEMKMEGAELDLGPAVYGAGMQFLMYFFVSLLIGAVSGIIFSVIFKVLDLHTIPWIEIGLFSLCSYFPFVLAEWVGCSGILAILILAIVMRNYAYYSMSPFGQITVEFGVEMIGNISENFVFAYVGISVPIMLSNLKIELVLIGCAALVISRAVSIFSVSVLINMFKKVKIPFSHQVVMTYGGLRGAVAFYLALEVHSEFSEMLLTTTISLIIFTVVGLGTTTMPLLLLLNKWFPQDKILLTNSHLDEEPEEEEEPMDDKKSIGMITKIEQFDDHFIKPALRKNGWVDVMDDGPNNEI